MNDDREGKMIQFPKTFRCDLPAGEDSLHLNAYTQGLANFISSCPLPMTVSLQGSWGSGKSSMMKLLEKALAEKALCIDFNTWQYSQFDLGEQLPILFFQSLMEKLGKTDKQKETEADNRVKNACKQGLMLAARLTARHMGLEEILNGSLDIAKGLKEPGHVPSLAETLEGLRTSFETLVRARLQQEGKDRAVFFVDDLDRLPPARAVELMEVLKTTLECDCCVFVLAIDYEVVIRGVKEKYGEDFGEEKGRSFFDKMIQLPFDLPVEQYRMDDFLDGLIQGIGNLNCTCALLGTDAQYSHIERPGDRQYVEDMAVLAAGRNPRSLKRFFNSFSLLVQVADACQNNNTWNREYVLFFGVVALKSSYPKLYSYLMDVCHDGLRLRDFYSWFHTSAGWEDLQRNEPALAASLGLSDLSDTARARVTGFVHRFFQMGYFDWIQVDSLNKFRRDELIDGQDGFPFPIKSWQTLEVVLEASSACDISLNQLHIHGADRFIVLASAIRYLTEHLKLEEDSQVTPQLLSQCWKHLIDEARNGLVVMVSGPDNPNIQNGVSMESADFLESAFWAILAPKTSPKAFRELVTQAFQRNEEGNRALDHLTDVIEAITCDPPQQEFPFPIDTAEGRRRAIRECFIPAQSSQAIADILQSILLEDL